MNDEEKFLSLVILCCFVASAILPDSEESVAFYAAGFFCMFCWFAFKMRERYPIQ